MTYSSLTFQRKPRFALKKDYVYVFVHGYNGYPASGPDGIRSTDAHVGVHVPWESSICKGCGCKATQFCLDWKTPIARLGNEKTGILTMRTGCGMPVCDNCIHDRNNGHFNPIYEVMR